MTRQQSFRANAFTLIELLIVVAIIAILAAIAVPNFLEAQTRSKVSRTKSDMRTFATGIEAYYVDNNAYPNCHRFGIPLRSVADDGSTAPLILERLSTPIAYLTTSLVTDPFTIRTRTQSATAQAQLTEAPTNVIAGSDAVARYNSYIYQSFNSFQRYTLPPDGFSSAALDQKGRAWVFHSAGPDGNYQNLGGVLANDRSAQLQYTIGLIYDATNGTISFGSIYRTGGSPGGGTTTYAAGEGLLQAIQRTQ